MPDISIILQGITQSISLFLVFHILYSVTWGLNHEKIKYYLQRYTALTVGIFLGFGSIALIDRLGQNNNEQVFMFILNVIIIIGIFTNARTYTVALASMWAYLILFSPMSLTVYNYLVIIIATSIIFTMNKIEDSRKVAYLYALLSCYMTSYAIEVLSIGVLSAVTILIKYAAVGILLSISYAVMSMIEGVYIHAKKLEIITEYEGGNVIRSALRLDAMRQFVADNRIRYGFLSVLGFEGIEEIKRELGEETNQLLMEKVTNALEDVLQHENVIFFKASEKRYGVFMHHRDPITSLKTELEGNAMRSRLGDDVLSVTERALERLPTHYVVKGEWVSITPFCGTAILGIHTNDIDKAIEYAEFTLNTRNEIENKNIVQLFDIKKHLIYKEDSTALEKIKSIVDVNSIYVRFLPIIDTETAKIIAYDSIPIIEGNDYVSQSELFKIANDNDILPDLIRLTAQISLRSFDQYDKHKLFVRYDFKALGDSFNMSEFVNKVHRFGATPERISLYFNMEYGIPQNDVIYRNLALLKKRGVDITFSSADLLGKKFKDVFRMFKPDNISISNEVISRITIDKNAVDIVRVLTKYCKKNNIKVICGNTYNKASFEIIRDNGVDLLTGPLLGEPSKIPGPISSSIDSYIKLNKKMP